MHERVPLLSKSIYVTTFARIHVAFFCSPKERKKMKASRNASVHACVAFELAVFLENEIRTH